MNRDFQQLRKIFEGGDPFMSNGHQIVKLRTRKRTVPAWTRNNKEVQKVLLRSFPKLATDSRQRIRAARWARIIHLYFRLQWTYRQVADELGITPERMHDLIRNICRSAAGLRADGTGRFSLRSEIRACTNKA